MPASVTDYGAAGDPRSGATSLAAWATAVAAALDGDDTTVDARVSAHASDTTSVHGIADTSALALTGDAPTAHAASHAAAGGDAVTVAESQVTGLTAALAAKAPLASPTLTGTVTVPTPDAGSETTVAASTAWAAERAKVGNLLTANQASGTDTLGTTAGFALYGTTIARDATWAHEGTGSILTTRASAGQGFLVIAGATNAATGTIPVKAGQVYTFTARVRSAASTDQVQTRIRWFQSDGTTAISYSQGGWAPLTSSGQLIQITVTAPANAAYACALIEVNATAAMDWNTDAFGFWAGAGGAWAMPGVPITNLGTKVSHPNTDDVLVQRWDSSLATPGWQTIHYDSGWRAIATWGTDGVATWAGGYTAGTGLTPTAGVAGYLRMRRVGPDLHIRIVGGTTSASWGWTGGAVGFVPASGVSGGGGRLATACAASMNAAGTTYLTAGIAGDATWPLGCIIPSLSDAIPTSLPGTLVSAAPA